MHASPVPSGICLLLLSACFFQRKHSTSPRISQFFPLLFRWPRRLEILANNITCCQETGIQNIVFSGPRVLCHYSAGVSAGVLQQPRPPPHDIRRNTSVHPRTFVLDCTTIRAVFFSVFFAFYELIFSFFVSPFSPSCLPYSMFLDPRFLPVCVSSSRCILHSHISILDDVFVYATHDHVFRCAHKRLPPFFLCLCPFLPQGK